MEATLPACCAATIAFVSIVSVVCAIERGQQGCASVGVQRASTIYFRMLPMAEFVDAEPFPQVNEDRKLGLPKN